MLDLSTGDPLSSLRQRVAFCMVVSDALCITSQWLTACVLRCAVWLIDPFAAAGQRFRDASGTLMPPMWQAEQAAENLIKVANQKWERALVQ